MSNSRNRNKDFDTIHHITSRIAHKVRFLQDEDQRNDLVEMIRRTAEFSGVKLLGWCVMINHFHILAFLPQPEEISEDEVVRRYGVLKGTAAANCLLMKLATLRLHGEGGNKGADKCLDAIRKRMYSIASFLKIVKQWFTEEYNRRNSHKGTLWEGVYFDRVVPHEQIEKCLGYLHLNPIRAAACATYDAYAWSSYSAFRKGDPVAIDGMRFVYDQKDEKGNLLTLGEIAAIHEELLDSLLEEHKRRIAEDIARKRAAGQNPPLDQLTTEAMVAQATAHMEEVRTASMELAEQRKLERSDKAKHVGTQRQILSFVELYPGITTGQLMNLVDASKSSKYRILADLKSKGVLTLDAKGWRLSLVGKKV
jgi:REP element-mobilizing transposase RayT